VLSFAIAIPAGAAAWLNFPQKREPQFHPTISGIVGTLGKVVGQIGQFELPENTTSHGIRPATNRLENDWIPAAAIGDRVAV
jgi:hypothetical protein